MFTSPSGSGTDGTAHRHRQYKPMQKASWTTTPCNFKEVDLSKKTNEYFVEVLKTHGVVHIGTTDFLFDLEDLPIIKSREWYKDKDGYLASSYVFSGKRCFLMFHRIIMGAKPHQFIDHINKNRADNRKKNLRVCTCSESNRNRGRYSTNKSGITGVYYDKSRKKWVASITYNNRKLYVGRFQYKGDAVMARLEKEMELFKDFAPQRELYDSLVR